MEGSLGHDILYKPIQISKGISRTFTLISANDQLQPIVYRFITSLHDQLCEALCIASRSSRKLPYDKFAQHLGNTSTSSQ